MENSYRARAVGHLLNVFKEFGVPVTSETRLLDFGCGQGEIVYHFRKAGVQAYGVDIENQFVTFEQRMINEGLSNEPERVLRVAEQEPYRLPFEDNFFDAVVSDQVMEHVQNHHSALMEMHRILKPGGVALHVFPPRWRPLEVHTHILLGGVFRSLPYLTLWALVGVRNIHQKKMNFRETAKANCYYLAKHTNYPTKTELTSLVSRVFSHSRFVEREYIQNSPGRARYLHIACKLFPWTDRIYSGLRQRVLLMKKNAPGAHRAPLPTKD